MSQSTQEFFWTPDELLEWLKRVCKEFGLWLVVWRVGQDADTVDPESIQPSMLDAIHADSIQFFIGERSLTPEPRWRAVGNRREIDFGQSYAVQLVPSTVGSDGKTIFQGRLAILQATSYDDSSRAAELTKLFRKLKSDLKRNSDARHIVVQLLPNGETKRWRSMLVGKAISAAGVKLRQFAQGGVEFGVEPE